METILNIIYTLVKQFPDQLKKNTIWFSHTKLQSQEDSVFTGYLQSEAQRHREQAGLLPSHTESRSREGNYQEARREAERGEALAI